MSCVKMRHNQPILYKLLDDVPQPAYSVHISLSDMTIYNILLTCKISKMIHMSL